MKAFIFDLDGTLIDSLKDLAEAVNRTLDQHGFPCRPLAEFPKLIGEGVHRLIEQAVPEDALPNLNLGSIVSDYQRHYDDTWSETTRPYPGILDVLGQLREAGVKTAVLSNKQEKFTRLCCDRFFPEGSFDAVVGAREGVPRKPLPKAGLDLMQDLGVSSSESIYVGDSGLDMQFAVNTGMMPVGVLWGFRSKEELLACGAARLATKPAELLSVL